MSSKETSIILLTKFKPENALWGFIQLAFGRFFFKDIPGLKFVKFLGSGKNAGFGLRPSPIHQGLFCCFDSEKFARDFLNNNQIVKKYKKKSVEFFSAELKSFSSKGAWSKNTIQESINPPGNGPIASLTRASIKITKAQEFWSLAPPSEASLKSFKGCILSAGLGEAPFLRQCTFSIWDSVFSLDSYARSGAHLNAIKSAYQGNFFVESMFVRFKPLSLKGVWQGKSFD